MLHGLTPTYVAIAGISFYSSPSRNQAAYQYLERDRLENIMGCDTYAVGVAHIICCLCHFIKGRLVQLKLRFKSLEICKSPGYVFSH